MYYAATRRHLDVLEWLHTIKPMACSTAAMDGAAANGYLQIVQWLHRNRTEGCTTNAMDIAAQNGHLDVVQWLHTNRTEGCTVNAVDFAATNGRLEVVKWLLENRTEGCTTDAIDQAVARCQSPIVHWLLSNTSMRCTSAAMENYPQLEIMQWLHSTGRGVFTQKVIERAILVGDLQAIAWLHQNFPQLNPVNVSPWDDGCSFEMLLFLREHYLRVFSWEFIETIVGLGMESKDSANEMNVVGWLLNEFRSGTRGWRNDILWKRPEVDFAGSLAWLASLRP